MNKQESKSVKQTELIRQIPDFTFDTQQLYAAVQEPGTIDMLGGTYLGGKVSTDFENWHGKYPWVPLLNAKRLSNFAEAIFTNEESRIFIEGINADNGKKMMSRINLVQASCHIARLLSTPNSHALTVFSLMWMRYLLVDTDSHATSINNFVSASRDGNAGTQFWTIAPYLFDELKILNIEEVKAFDTTLKWSGARTAVTKTPEMDAKYPGIPDPYEIGNGDFWYLSSNSTGPSHILAREVSKHIAKNLIKSV